MESQSDRQAWLQWRRSGIGSSDAAAVHGCSPYKTPLELYEDKFSELSDNIEEETSFVMERGNQFEPIARKLFAAEWAIQNLDRDGEEFAPRRAVSADLPILICSLDGCTKECDETIEIKYQGAEAHERVADEKLPIRGGRVPEHYWMQCQHNLLVTGAKWCWFISYNPKAAQNLLYVKVLPDVEFFKLHIEKCAEFWANGQKGIEPPPTDKDYVLLRTKGAKLIAKRMEALKRQKKEIEAEYDALEEELLKMVTHPRMRVGALRINQITKQGSIDYARIPEIKAMPKETLEQYRKKASTYYTVNLEKAAE